MTNKISRLAAKLTTAAMVVSMFAMSAPAHAAGVSSAKDLVDRMQISVAATHDFSFNIATTVPVAGTITVTFPGSYGTLSAVGTATGTGGCTLTASGSGSNVLTLTVSVASCTAGAVTATGAIATNPGTAGPYSLAIATSAGDSGDISTSILTDDTINVTASVSSTFTYDIMVASACNTAASSSTYVVALGTLTPGTVVNATSQLICQKLYSNATGGAIVEVNSLNGGLTSASAAYTIASAGGLLASPGEGYGLCGSTSNAVSGTVDVASYTFDSACPTVGAVVQSTWTGVADTNGGVVNGGSTAGYYDAITLTVSALSNTSTPAANDYRDELTFRAYGTF